MPFEQQPAKAGPRDGGARAQGVQGLPALMTMRSLRRNGLGVMEDVDGIPAALHVDEVPRVVAVVVEEIQPQRSVDVAVGVGAEDVVGIIVVGARDRPARVLRRVGRAAVFGVDVSVEVVDPPEVGGGLGVEGGLVGLAGARRVEPVGVWSSALFDDRFQVTMSTALR